MYDVCQTISPRRHGRQRAVLKYARRRHGVPCPVLHNVRRVNWRGKRERDGRVTIVSRLNDARRPRTRESRPGRLAIVGDTETIARQNDESTRLLIVSLSQTNDKKDTTRFE